MGPALDAAPPGGAGLTVEALDGLDDPAWDAYCAAHPDASLYHGLGWARIVRGCFGHEMHHLRARDATGALRGVLPMMRLRSALFGDFVVSLPFVNYGGLLADDAEATAALVGGARALRERLGVSHIELRHDAGHGLDLPARTEKVTMLRALPDDPDVLSKELGSKLRSQVRRAGREGAEMAFGGLELVDEFYAVFAENMRDLGTPVYPRRWFRDIASELGEAVTIAVVRVGGAPAAAGFLIGHRSRLEIPWASSLRRFNRLSVNMMLYGEVLRFAVERGFDVFDFGRSTRDSNTYRFKRQWGAEEHPLVWHYVLAAGGELPRMNPDNPKYALAIKAWQRLPLPVANTLGPFIVRHLP